MLQRLAVPVNFEHTLTCRARSTRWLFFVNFAPDGNLGECTHSFKLMHEKFQGAAPRLHLQPDLTYTAAAVRSSCVVFYSAAAASLCASFSRLYLAALPVYPGVFGEGPPGDRCIGWRRI